MDGDADGVHSRDGLLLDGDRNNVPGGDFVFTLGILPGDTSSTVAVTNADLQVVRSRLGTTATEHRTAAPYYILSTDFNADGHINVTDLALVRRRLGTYIPPRFASPASFDPIGPPVRTRPGSRDLFGSAPILP